MAPLLEGALITHTTTIAVVDCCNLLSLTLFFMAKEGETVLLCISVSLIHPT